MNNENLIPLKPKGDKRSDEIRANPLRPRRTEKTKLGNQIMAMKLTKPENLEKKALELVASEELSAVTIMKYLTELMKRTDLEDGLRIQLIGKQISAHTAIHGSKSKNLNINKDFSEVTVNIKEVVKGLK